MLYSYQETFIRNNTAGKLDLHEEVFAMNITASRKATFTCRSVHSEYHKMWES